jgi:hypothetical protein
MRAWVAASEAQNAWTPPDGLDRCRPRQVRLNAAGMVMTVLAWSLLAGGLIAGIILGMVASRQDEEERLFRRESVVTQGQVTRVWRGGDQNQQLWISYSFSVEGLAHQGRGRLGWESWRGLQPGSRIAVHYLPSRPGINYPLEGKPQALPPIVPVLIALSLALPGVLIMIKVRRQLWLLAEGRAAPGRITSLSKLRSEMGRCAYVEFTLLSGIVCKGKTGPTKKPPAVGSKVTVVYDPDNPVTLALYPFALATLSDRRPLQ